LQPLNREEKYLKGAFYEPFKTQLLKYQNLLPTGTKIPVESEPFFSSLALWTVFPVVNEVGFNILVGEAILEYTKCYCQLLKSAQVRESFETKTLRKKAINEYKNYRIDRDPAKNLLSTAFGTEWTTNVLKNVLFPIS
jgi:phycoerythrobilin:ferredoxin oxidoreductase